MEPLTQTNAIHARRAFWLVRICLCVAFGSATLLAFATAAHAEPERKRTVNPAVLTEISKDPQLADDFLRFAFLDVGTVPTQLARPNALRTFMTYSAFFEPALPVAQAVRLVGLEPVENQTFAVYRCKHPNLDVLDPVLAKWPEIFDAIIQDFGSVYSCPATTDAPENEILCIAESFQDTPMPTASEALANLYDIAAMITGNPVLQGTLRTIYGIDVGFSGLGLAVNGSGNPAFPFSAENVLDQAIVPEYLVENAFIAEAGCHCILVPPYPGRSRAFIDPDFVWEVGTPECRTVSRLPKSDEGCSSPPIVHREKKHRRDVHKPRGKGNDMRGREVAWRGR